MRNSIRFITVLKHICDDVYDDDADTHYVSLFLLENRDKVQNKKDR